MTDVPEIGWDPKIGSLILKVTEQWIISVIPMTFNDRVCLTHREFDYPHGWTAAFCYDKGLPAVVAALAWDPEEEDEPVGYKKVAGDSRPKVRR